MPFDPALPADHSPNSAAQMRAQLTGLKSLIDAVSGVTSAVVDSVTTGAPGDPPAITMSVVGSELHFAFVLPKGDAGPQGPPFASVLVDSVTTINPGEMATAQATFDGAAVHLSFAIPRGDDGQPGPIGPIGMTGEVSAADLNAALVSTSEALLLATSGNSNAVDVLAISPAPTYDTTQQQQLIDKINQLIIALRR